MEKFGIFELLDALSALTDGARTQRREEAPPADAQSPLPDRARTDAPQRDGSFGEEKDKNAQALDAFYSRHERISRKIDGK